MAQLVVQLNLNNCRAAQDLLFQHVLEWQAGLVALSEPYNAAASPDWLASTDSLAVLGVGPGNRFPPLRLLGRGAGFVVAQWGPLCVTSVYFSPNATRAAFGVFLRLFPILDPFVFPPSPFEWQDELSVTEAEVTEALKRRRSRSRFCPGGKLFERLPPADLR